VRLRRTFDRLRMVATSATLALAPSFTKLKVTALNSVLKIQAVVGKFLIFTNLTDGLSVAQIFRWKLDRSVSDNVGVTDDPKIVPNKRITDPVNLTDAQTFSYAKPLIDNVINISGNYFAEDYVSEDYVASDFVWQLDKPFANAVALTDTFSPVYGKGLTDGAETADSLVLSASKIIVDIPTVTDSPALDVQKPLTDSFSVAEAYVAVYTKPISDGTSVTESSVLGVSKAVTDPVDATDSGSLRMQDYCDFTYFAEDYVGTSLTF